jgi:hypothetical protein
VALPDVEQQRRHGIQLVRLGVLVERRAEPAEPVVDARGFDLLPGLGNAVVGARRRCRDQDAHDRDRHVPAHHVTAA